MGRAARVARSPFAERRILLGVTAGIAAFKSIALARELTLAGARVETILTPGAREFVTPLSFQALTGAPVYTEMYGPDDPLLHIRLAREADLVLVAPATADFIARAAVGMGDDLLSTVLLATTAPVVICPAMNDRMFAHPRTLANLAELERIGYAIAGPDDGMLARGEGSGPGRMLDPEILIEHAARALTGPTPLTGKRVLITAGPTREAIDPVRFIGNRSSGRMGYALAESAWQRGAEVVLVTGPSSLYPPHGVRTVDVESAQEMLEAVSSELPGADVLVMAAAVADFRPSDPAGQKIKKGRQDVSEIPLEPTRDILKSLHHLRPDGSIIVGFALETESAVENGQRKLVEKDLDLLVVNDAREPGAGFEVETNRVTILDREGIAEELPILQKSQVADEILDRVARRLPVTP